MLANLSSTCSEHVVAQIGFAVSDHPVPPNGIRRPGLRMHTPFPTCGIEWALGRAPWWPTFPPLDGSPFRNPKLPRCHRLRSDWCETHKVETIRANVIGCLNLADVCNSRGLHMTYYGTGCIFHYDEDFPVNSGKGFKESDKPNFTGSYYSHTKVRPPIVHCCCC
jgi:hypothetical protein